MWQTNDFQPLLGIITVLQQVKWYPQDNFFSF